MECRCSSTDCAETCAKCENLIAQRTGLKGGRRAGGAQQWQLKRRCMAGRKKKKKAQTKSSQLLRGSHRELFALVKFHSWDSSNKCHPYDDRKNIVSHKIFCLIQFLSPFNKRRNSVIGWDGRTLYSALEKWNVGVTSHYYKAIGKSKGNL